MVLALKPDIERIQVEAIIIAHKLGGLAPIQPTRKSNQKGASRWLRCGVSASRKGLKMAGWDQVSNEASKIVVRGFF